MKIIAIVDNRGLTFVGDADTSDPRELTEIRDARCIIWWGTDEHLAQIVDGPRPDTKLGASKTIRVTPWSVVAVYECGDGWE